LIVAAQQNNLSVLYPYYNSFFVPDVCGELGKCASFRHITCNFVWKCQEKSGFFLSGEW